MDNMDSRNDQALTSTNQREPTAAKAEDDDPSPAPEVFIESYTIAWICALQAEFQAACQMLDIDDFETPKGMESFANDRNIYVFGRLGLHYVVVGCLPRGRLGLINAANVAKDMIRSFPNLKFALMVGIGGGAPTKKRDIRLGDVVVSVPSSDHGGVVQLDFGTRLSNGMFKRKGQLNSPPDALLAATQEVQRVLDNPKKQDKIAEHMARMDHMPDFDRPSCDRLYRSDYIHREAGDARVDVNSINGHGYDEDEDEDEDEDGCKYCEEDGLVSRKDRRSFRKVTAHYGTIASDNVVMRDAAARDKHARDKDLNVLCFEMEAGGLMNNIQCLVIRGICDYSDSHKNDDWHKYAALAAAAYARELLMVLRPQMVAGMPPWAVETQQLNKKLKKIEENQQDLNRQTMIENQKAEEFRTNHRLVLLKNQLMGSDRTAWDNNQDTYEKASRDHHGGTCEWLFDRKEFKTWIADDSARPVLWLNGKHGAGKTVLCAAAIRHLAPNIPLPQTDPRDLSTSKNSLIVVRQFLSKDAYVPQRQLLRMTAAQLMDSLIQMDLDSIPNSILPFLNISNDDSTTLESLIHAILLELPLTYIFIDGLDDAEYTDIPMSTLAPHPPKDVKLFVEFLIKEATNNPEKIRLWLGSQPLPDIRQYVCNPKLSGPDSIGEIQLTTNDTYDDIMRYLSHYIPSSTRDKSDFARILVRRALKSEVEGSFLWAAEILNAIKDETEDNDDIFELVHAGLPLEMGKLYEKVIHRIIDNDKKPKHPPLWKLILSLLAFAKRPLKMSEVIEAIAILRTLNGNNMRKDIVSEEKILKCCLSLVWHTPRIKDGRNVGLVRLSHSAVRAFLLNKEDSKIDLVSKSLPLVETWIIRDCCIQYLSQPRYGALLEKRNSTEFRTLDGVSVLANHFLLYAAKYWFQHFDLPDEGKDTAPDCDISAVRAFLRSPNFRTTLQIQSLFITGHFLQSFDSITDRGLSVRRTLPNWMPKQEPELHRQYHAFQGEWSRLLQSKRSDSFRGEVNRCFWGALGSGSFLSSHANLLGRYISFEFSNSKNSRREGDSCQVHQASQDGQGLVTAWVRTQENQKQICVETWTLDGKSCPRAKSMTIMPFSVTDTSMALYTLPCSQSFYSIPLIPRVDSVVPPDAIALRLDGRIIRLGSKVFCKGPTDSLCDTTGFRELTGKSFGDSWEDVCIRDPFLVVCRRRVYRKPPETTDRDREGRRVNQLRRRMAVHEGYRSRPRTRNVSPLPTFLQDSSSLPHLPHQIQDELITGEFTLDVNLRVADLDGQSSGYISNSETNSTSSRGLSDLPSAEESWSEGVSFADDSSSDEIYSQEPEESEDDISGDDSDMNSLYPEDDDSDLKSVLSAKSGESQATNGSGSLASLNLSQILSNSSSESNDEEIQSDISEDETLHAEPAVANPEPEGPVVIGKSTGRIECDSCGKGRLRTWYHCIICSNADFDLCDRCERKGVWCLDVSHQLYKIIGRKPSGVVSRRSFNVRQQLAVYRTDVPGEKPAAFHFQRKYRTMLYDSPPVVHQKHPLVIWALSDSRLLFADLTRNQFFEQKITPGPGTKKAHPVCVSLSFSPCGKILRIAIIDVTAEKAKPGTRSTAKQPPNAPKARLCLNLHVLVLQLSSTQPARDRPKLLASTSCRLGCSCARAFVPTLPFAFTWGASELYLTLSDSSLRVYRVMLPDIDSQSPETIRADQAHKGEFKFTVKVPKEIILLPRSSRNRSVQFFPARTRDAKATVIIGPRYGQNPAPPIGVYLCEKDIGDWIDLEETRNGEGNVHPAQKTLGTLFEEPWDEDQDCILIPFDGY